MASKLKKQYNKEIVPALKEKFSYKNVNEVPCLERITVNVGYGRHAKEAGYIDNVINTLQAITGQRPIHNKAKKSISNFKIREGMDIGASVTLRGDKMYDFVEKLINITFPRVRDFRGLNRKSFDKQGNYTIGFKEHIAFPEIKSDAVDQIHGLEVVVSTTAKNKEEGEGLLKALGFPFKK